MSPQETCTRSGNWPSTTPWVPLPLPGIPNSRMVRYLDPGAMGSPRTTEGRGGCDGPRGERHHAVDVGHAPATAPLSMIVPGQAAGNPFYDEIGKTAQLHSEQVLHGFIKRR